MTPREELHKAIKLYVLKQHREEIREAIDRFIKYRDTATEYYKVVNAEPFEAQWERIGNGR
jgi:hypothetical protein